MLHLTIIAVGKLKERYWTDACAEYLKRLGAYCKPVVLEIDEYRLPASPSDAEIIQCIDEEGKRILKAVPKNGRLIALCIEGNHLSSEALSTQLSRLTAEASHLVFVIGGSHGLSDAIKQAAILRLSMSPMTFPHQLARVMLLEQLYRALGILGGSKYHK